jgi:hypothetical protein
MIRLSHLPPLVAAIGLVAVAVVLEGCAHECQATALAIKAADVACARAGVAVGDPVLLTRCADAYYSQRSALTSGACASHVKKAD